MTTSTGITVTTSPNDDRLYRHVRLSNQLEILLVSDSKTEKAACCCDVRVGAMSDPDVGQGLAHFLEHMLFMGTTKYPEENAYSAFLASHGGSSNAYTSQENTVYYFDVQADHFEESLDLFSSFFTCPLFSASSVSRELNAVDSENSKNLQSDGWRSYQLMKSFAKADHPFSKFSTGNLKTLQEEPAAHGLDVRDLLLEFYDRYYSANLMRVCVYGKEDLDVLESWATAKFSDVPNKSKQVTTFGSEPYGPAELSKLTRVVPIKDNKSLELGFQLPPLEALYRSKPQQYISHLLGHESEGSILAALKSKGWANGLSAYLGHSHNDFSILELSIELTDVGSNNVDSIVSCVFTYIGMLRQAGPVAWIGQEIKEIAEMNFRFLDKTKPISYTCKLANNMHNYTPEDIISGYHLFLDGDISATAGLVDRLRPDNVMIFHCDKKWAGQTTKTEKWYGTEYEDVPFSAEQREAWFACYNGDVAADKEGSWAGLLCLPERNPFVPTDFELRSAKKSAQVDDGEISLLVRDDAGIYLDESVYASEEEAAVAAAALLAAEESKPTETEGGAETETAEGDGDEEEGEDDDDEEGDEDDGETPPPAAGVKMEIQAGQAVQTWYRLDKVWKVPKTYIAVSLETNHASSTPLAVALCDTLATFLKELLNEFSYYADCAGLHYDVSLSKSGLEMKFAGFNHKLPVLVEKTLSQLKEIALVDTAVGNKKYEDVYLRVKEGIVRGYYNNLFWAPYYTCISGSAMCLEDPRWTSADKHRALLPADFKDFCSFTKGFLHSLKAEVLVHGDASPEEAKLLSSSIHSTLSFLPLSSVQEPIRRVVDLHPGIHYIYRQHSKHFNPEEPNSAIENIYMISPVAGAGAGANDIRLKLEAIGALLVQMMDEAAFDQLRTKEALGYIVFTGIKKLSQMTALQLIVQSNHKDPDYLDGRIESFLQSYRNVIESMTEDTLASFRQATIEKLLEKPKNYSEDAKRYNAEITQRTYLFDRRSILAQSVLPSVSKDDILQFYDQYVSATSNQRRKFSSCFYGKGRKFPPKGAAAALDVEVIRDPVAFKRKMALLPELAYDAVYAGTTKKVCWA